MRAELTAARSAGRAWAATVHSTRAQLRQMEARVEEEAKRVATLHEQLVAVRATLSGAVAAGDVTGSVDGGGGGVGADFLEEAARLAARWRARRPRRA